MSSNNPYPPDPNRPQGDQYPPTQQYPVQPPTEQYPSQQPSQQPSTQQGYPQQQPSPQGYPAQPAGGQGGGNKQLWIIIGAIVATAVVVVALVFGVQALTGDDDNTATAAAKATATAAPSSPASAAATPSTVPSATSSTATKTFPKAYAVHEGDEFGIQKPAGWATKLDANSKFFRDAPIIELAQNNVTYWNNPTTYPSETGFSVTDLTSTANTPADFINALAPSTTQRPVCANYAGYAVPFTRGDWTGQKLDSGVCSDTNGRAILIAATRASDGAKIGVLIRGPEPTSATENQALNAFDTYRS